MTADNNILPKVKTERTERVEDDEMDDAVELIVKTQSRLEGLQTKLLGMHETKNKLLEQNERLSSKAGELNEVKKQLEEKNLKLTKEVRSLRLEEQEHNNLKRLNNKLRRALDVTNSEYHVSIDEHAKTKVENEKIRRRNFKLSQEIASLTTKLGNGKLSVKSEESPGRARSSSNVRRSESRDRSRSFSPPKPAKTHHIRSRGRGGRSRGRPWQKRARSRSPPHFNQFKRRRGRSPLRRGPPLHSRGGHLRRRRGR